MSEEQLAFEIPGNKLIRLVVVVSGAVGAANEQALPLLAPIVFVVAIVVISGLRDADFEEVRVPEHGISGGIAAAGMAPDSCPIEIDPRIALRQFLHARDLIWKCVVAQISKISVLKLF